MKFRGGGATRKTAPDSDLTISHSSAKDNLSPKPLKKTCLEEFYENRYVILSLTQNLSILIKNIWHFWWQKCRKTIRHATFTNNLHGSTRKPANSLTLIQSRLLPYVSPAIIVHSAIAAKSLCHSELVSESLNTSTDSGSEAGMTGTESNILHRKVQSDEGSRTPCTPSRHSDGNQSLSMPVNLIRHLWQQKSRKTAFTMAEVLITLGIIGIVAAMTLPSLIGNYQEKQWKVAYKKAYSSMSQAFMRMQANDEFQDMSNLVITNPDIGLEGTAAVGENFKIMSKYFNTVKTCFDKNQDECWVCEDGQSGHGADPDWLGCNKSAYAFIDYSGIAWALYSNTEYPILVDVNGDKRPNRLGQDRFVMLFASNGSDEVYSGNVNTISPWRDFKYKTRWCPSGNCLYKTWILE